MPSGQRPAVVAQDGPQAHERVVDLGDFGLLGLLVAGDRADEVAVQAARGDGEPGEPDLAEPVPHAFERGPAGAHDEHALAGADELADRVDDGLGAARARQSVHGERLAGDDPREQGLLLRVGVEEEPVGGGRALVGAHGLRDAADEREVFAVGLVPGERVQDGVIEVAAVALHVRGDVGEGGDDEPRLHREGVDVGGQRTQVVDDRLRLEDAGVVREARERTAVEVEAEVGAGGLDELRVHGERTVQLQVEVGVVTADRQRAEEDGRRVGDPADPPGRHADGEVDRVQAPRGPQLDILRRDALGGQARGPQCHLVAEQVGQQRRAAGDELRQAAGVGVGDLDARVAGIRVVQERGGPAQLSGLLAESAALGLGDMSHDDSRF